MDQSCVHMATDGGLAGITLIIEPPSPPLLLCHLSSASNVILTPGPAMTSLHQAAALREASHSSLQKKRKKKDNTKFTSTLRQLLI